MAHQRRNFHPDAPEAGQARQRDRDSEVLQLAYANGGKAAADLDYVPMPPSVIAAIQKSWGEIKDGAGKPVAFK